MARNVTVVTESSDLLAPLHALVQESRANFERLNKRMKDGKLNPEQLPAELVDTVMSILTDGFDKVLGTLAELEDWADGVDEDLGRLLAQASADEEPGLLPEQANELKSLLLALLAEVPSTSEVRGALEARVDKQVQFLDEVTMSEESEDADDDEDDEEEEEESATADPAAN